MLLLTEEGRKNTDLKELYLAWVVALINGTYYPAEGDTEALHDFARLLCNSGI